MRLTGRQRAFLRAFLDLYREEDHPIHYTLVAERLGVGKVTAYDMLRLLEEKGLVRSEYVLPENRAGAGRSSVVFFPTDKAARVSSQWAGDDWEQSAWKEVKETILQSLREGKGRDYEDLLENLLLRLEKQYSPLVSAAEMITAVILSLRQIQHNLATNGLTERLKAMGFPGELGLEALGGLTVGLSFVERLNRRLTGQLLRHVQNYQANLSRLNTQNRQRLADFAQEVWRLTGP